MILSQHPSVQWPLKKLGKDLAKVGTNNPTSGFTASISDILTPCAGRRVIVGKGVDDGVGRERGAGTCRAIVARSSVASIRAKLLPMQILGPPPKGK